MNLIILLGPLEQILQASPDAFIYLDRSDKMGTCAEETVRNSGVTEIRDFLIAVYFLAAEVTMHDIFH